MDDAPRLLWAPADDARSTSRLGAFLDRLEADHGVDLPDHEAAWAWSVDHLGELWTSLWDHFDLPGVRGDVALAEAGMPGATWFPDASLNYAEAALRMPDDATAVIGRSQTRDEVLLTAAELRDQVARCAAGLRTLGVVRGDRVAAYLPNIPEAVVAFLATASIGAVWASCAPEFGTRSVVDRLSQIEPKVLFVVGGYRYGTKDVHRTTEVAQIRAALGTLEAVVEVPYLPTSAPIPSATTWGELLADDAPLRFERVPFAHPLYILYSSGTTGLPKPIVHGHGGITLEHVKATGLYCDLGAGDRFFWFSTTGWMMWNFLVSGLLVGSAVVLFDGNPGHPDLDALWQLAEETEATFFGVSAPFLMACRKEGLRPRDDHDLSRLRAVGSTGAPLPTEGFDWVHDAVGEMLLSSISGGTDVCTAFVGGSPMTAVRAGEISCRYLGCRVEAFSPTGESLVGETGELVITAPMPSMPVRFWGDDDGSRYREAYFEDFPGVWRHGDWITITDRGSCVISGRSDATLNRGGVRLGTAEFYAVVDSLEEVADSLVIHLEDDEGGMGELLLFIAPASGVEVDDDLRAMVASALRTSLSPRHVPDAVIGVPGVPRTLSGKKLEVPVKRILRGTPVAEAASKGALANPEVLDAYVAFARAR